MLLTRHLVTRSGPAAERALGLRGLLILSVLQSACAATIPPGKQVVSELTVVGANTIDPLSLKQCLATHERDHFGFVLGQGITGCGHPPFTASHIPVRLWTWPWTPYPVYDPAVFERDLERVERFYQARGYYDAHIVETSITPHPQKPTVAITLELSEGQPVRVRNIAIEGTQSVPAALRLELQSAVRLVPEAPFDEYDYDASREAMQQLLGEAGYAHAEVRGNVQLSTENHWADVRFHVEAGPHCRFGNVYVEGHKDLPPRAIWGAASLDYGQPFSLSALEDARNAIYALGPFASVEVEPELDGDGAVIPVHIRVVPGRRIRWGFGVGMEVGGNQLQNQGAEATGDSFAQWDVHLLGRFEHRNFLGGMRRLQIEERPRIIFDEPFPRMGRPHPGNALSIDFRQPAFLEARTALLARVRWELGPDPYGGRFFRSQLTSTVGPERHFLSGALRLATTLNLHQFREIAAIEDGPYPDYDVVYFQHSAELELRDEPRAPTRGAYLALSVIHAGYLLPGDFDYVRITPEARGYLPLPLGIVLALRASLGVMAVTRSFLAKPAAGEDPGGFVERLQRFGPLQHRLRGGGHNSVRGYRPNTLGDVVMVDGRLDSGGTRQWLASAELRVPLTGSFGTVFFLDAGDVSQRSRFRWNYPQTTLGIGLRYHTLVGPLRLDVGFAPESLQVLGPDERIRSGVSRATILGLAPGAIQFTIGEAF